MSGSIGTPDSCPACGGTDINYREELETSICAECSFVVESAASVSTPKLNTNRKTDSEKLSWEQSISVQNNAEVNFIEVLSLLEGVTEALALSDELTVRGAEIASMAWETNFMHGRTKPDAVGATIYAASRERQNSIPPAMLAAELETDRQSLKNTYKTLKAELPLEIDPPRPREYVPHICHELELPQKVTGDAKELLQGSIPPGNPVGVAGASVYVTAEDTVRLTLLDIAEVTGLTKETIWQKSSHLRK
jgi:transcription initiation factor TFIIB